MKRNPLLYLFSGAVLLMLICPGIIMSQNISISDNGITTPDANAMLDIISTTKGLLIPRVALSATNLISPMATTPTTSMLVYNTATAGSSPNNVVPGFYYYNGTKWVPLGKGGWDLLGNAGTVASTNFLGTTDAVDMVVRTNNTERMRILSTGNVGIGTTAPASVLHISGASTNPVSLFQLTNDNTGNTTSDGFKITLSSGKIELNNQESAGLSLFTSNTERITILSGGNVGISTLAPAQKLDVTGNVQFSQALMPAGNAGSSGQVLTSQGTNTAPVWSAIGQIWKTYTTSALKTLINNTTGYDATDAGYIDVGGLSLTFTPTSSNSLILIFTFGSLETLSSHYGGSGCRVKVFYDGVGMGGNGEQTIDVEDGSGFIYTIAPWSMSTFKTISGAPVPHTIKVRAKKYAGFDNFYAGGSTTGLADEGALIIMEIPQ